MSSGLLKLSMATKRPASSLRSSGRHTGYRQLIRKPCHRPRRRLRPRMRRVAHHRARPLPLPCPPHHRLPRPSRLRRHLNPSRSHRRAPFRKSGDWPVKPSNGATAATIPLSAIKTVTETAVRPKFPPPAAGWPQPNNSLPPTPSRKWPKWYRRCTSSAAR